MIGAATWERLAARSTRVVGGHRAIVLEAGTVCYVESGSAGLFSAEAVGGAPSGPRRFLHRLGSGQAAFSTPHATDGGRVGQRFLVVPIQGAVLRTIPFEVLWDDMLAEETPLLSLIEEWVELLAGLFGDAREREVSTRIAADAECVLEAGQTLGADRAAVLWCELRAGAIRWMGLEAMTATPTERALPVTRGMWAESLGPARIQVQGTHELADARRVLEGLEDLERLVHAHLAGVAAREQAEELQRLRERDAREAARTEAAIGSLAAVLEDSGPAPAVGTPLFRAFAAVSRSIGCEATAPKAEVGSGSPSGAGSLDAIARASRIRIRRVILRGKWWRTPSGSFLTHTADDERRPMAVLRTPAGRFQVFDPITGITTRLTETVALGLERSAVILYRPLPEGPLRLIDLVVFSLRGRARDLTAILLTGLVATLLAMITPQATAVLMDHAVPDADRRLLFEVGLGLLAAALGRSVFCFSQSIVLLRFELGSEADSQAALWDRLLRLRPSFFRGFSSGDLQSRVMAVSEVGRQLSGIALTTLFSSAMALLNLALLYYYSPRLSVIALVVGFGVMAFTVFTSSSMRARIRELAELKGYFFGQVIQVIHGVSKLKVARAEDRAFVHWMRSYARQLELWSKTDRMADLIFVFNRLVPTVASAVMFVAALQMMESSGGTAQEPELTLGTFLAFTTAFAVFLGGATSLSNTIVSLLDVEAKGARIRPILQAEPEVDGTKTDPGVLTGRLALDKVDFRYRVDGPKVLDQVGLHAEPGELIAVVGASGSGKSTLLRLILGFEKPDSGTVSHDGQDLASLDVLALRQQMGVVLQGGSLDALSILDNIACGSSLTLEEAWAAAEAAGLAEEIREMPMGIHTLVSAGGGNLSGGQRQRLLIARALSRRPKLLLFDEATSALDNRTQAQVTESLHRLRVTRLVIAHRLSTIRNADRIYVLEGGRIVQTGRFEQLIDEEGPFSALMARQVV